MGTESPLRILLADDEEIIHRTIGDYLREAGHHMDQARDGAAALQSIRARHYDVALVDVRMPPPDGLSVLEQSEKIRPNMPVVIISGHADVEMAVHALRLGAADFLAKPIKLVELDAALAKSARLSRLRHGNPRPDGATIQASPLARRADSWLIGPSPATAKVRRQVREAAEAGCDTILLTGETGTGKEVVARQIHTQACSADQPFIAVSCPALPDSLVESELFGHVKGAFTGAVQDRAGYFEMADGSTIFLDEVGDLSLMAQAKILRVLESRTLRRVGGGQEISVAVRVIAATNAPLEDRVKEGSFRQDLFYRLNVYSIHLLPLRERRADIVPLAEHFLADYAMPRGLRVEGFAPESQDKLLGYDFPGNARELRYLVERAAIACRSGPILTEHVILPASGSPLAVPAADAERDRILAALHETRWNCRHAAEHLAMPYSTLRYKMQKLGIFK